MDCYDVHHGSRQRQLDIVRVSPMSSYANILVPMYKTAAKRGAMSTIPSSILYVRVLTTNEADGRQL